MTPAGERIGVLAVGCVTPLGDDPSLVLTRLAAGESALAPSPVLAPLPDARAGLVPGPDLKGWLTRRKDIRLLARAAVLALPAAGRALLGYEGDRESLGLFVAVGREPPDEGECEPSLAAMERDGHLDLARLGDEGRALYPPLLPLRTLPNMVLAHVSIQHAIRGENATFAGGPEAGRQALAEAISTLAEGRAPYALVGASWSAVDLASARDRWRLGEPDPPGEAAIFALIGPGGRPFPAPEALPATLRDHAWRAGLGNLGPVEGLLPLLAA